MEATTDSDLTVERNPVTVEQTSERELVVTRTFDGPARLVFEAFTKPELFGRWWVPRSMGMALESLEMDARTGGSYRLVFTGGAAFFGQYVEVTPHSRVVWTNEEGGETSSVTTVTFEEADGKTLLVLREEFASAEAFAEGAGAADATHETFAQLDELLVELQA
jgi:uncharacterized protein YndB with AHSA1/START domain